MALVGTPFSVAAAGDAPAQPGQGGASPAGADVAAGASARFAFTRLVVNDLADEARFYQAAFGYAAPMMVGGDINGRLIREAIFFAADGSIDFILLAFGDGRKAPTGGMISNFATPDIDALRAKVLAEGGAVHWDIRPMDTGSGIARTAFFTDPEGHMFQAIQK